MGSKTWSKEKSPRLLSGQRRGCLNRPWPMTILMYILLITIDPSSGEGRLGSRRPTLEQRIEPPEVRRGSGRRRNMKDEISTARDAITH